MFRVLEKYDMGTPMGLTPAEREAQDIRPPGLYKCPECRDTTIIWRTAVDKYKVKCAKCQTEMKHVALVPKPVPVVISANELEESAEIAEQYAVDPVSAILAAMAAGGVGAGVLGHRRAMKERAGLKKPIGPVGHAVRVSTLGVPYYVGRGMAMKKKKLPEKWAKRAAAAKAKIVTKHELDILAEIYGKDPQRALLAATAAGVPLRDVAFHYGLRSKRVKLALAAAGLTAAGVGVGTGITTTVLKQQRGRGSALTGLQLGAAHGKEESAGTRGAPGALKLWLLQKLHGSGYVIGRQKGLGGKHGGTKSSASILDEMPELLEGMLHGQAPA